LDVPNGRNILVDEEFAVALLVSPFGGFFYKLSRYYRLESQCQKGSICIVAHDLLPYEGRGIELVVIRLRCMLLDLLRELAQELG